MNLTCIILAHFRENQKRGQVIQKLNKIIQFLLDQGTQNTMLTEPWTHNYSGELAVCTNVENGKCTPTFDNEFEAQYYCEFLGDNCVGVSGNNGKFTTMKQIVEKSKGNSTSSIKAMWCSDSTPPFSVKLPSVFSASNQVRVMWPVVNLKEMFVLMGRSDNEFLARTWDSTPMTQADYNRFGLDITVMADTVIVDDHFAVYNVRNLKVIARKLIISKRTILTFRQVDIKSFWEPIWKAIDPDLGSCPTKDQKFCHGINGKHGEAGFPATTITFDFGCINGDENLLQVETFSGNGANGQHASNGTIGEDGRQEPTKEDFPRSHKCGVVTSCKDCCHGRSSGDRSNPGNDCKYPGSWGGNAGNGGNGGAPGKAGSIELYVAKGLPQNIQITYGKSGKGGNKGLPGKGGKQGKGGCGEGCSCDTTGKRLKTTCHGYTDCSLKGKDCSPNKDGVPGENGQSLTRPDERKIRQVIDTKHVINADSIQQDFMLKYAVMLMNNETINESQEILYFLTKFNSITGFTANQLLNVMNKNGKMETDVKVIPKQSYDVLHNRLNKVIKRGQRLEEAMNTIGEVFDFTHMFYSLVDTVLQVVEEELTDIRVEKQEAEEIVIESYNAMLQMNKAMAFRTFDIEDDIETLIFYINAQINSLYRAAKRQKRMSCVGAVFSCVPGIPKTGVKGAVGNSAKAYAADSIMNSLDDMQCDDLHILSFLNEFIYDFGQLGDDVACLRTPEDFKNFEAGALQEFFSGDLLDNLQSEEMWMDVECLIGLVEVPSNPPNFGLLPNPKDFFPLASMADKIAGYAVIADAIKQIMDCLKKDGATAKSTCFIQNCATIAKGVNEFLDTGVDCSLLDFEYVFLDKCFFTTLLEL